jgi:hypothetical protein
VPPKSFDRSLSKFDESIVYPARKPGWQWVLALRVAFLAFILVMAVFAFYFFSHNPAVGRARWGFHH